MFLEISDKFWIEKEYDVRDFKNTLFRVKIMLKEILIRTWLEKKFFVRDFKNIRIITTWLEEQYITSGLQNYLNNWNLIGRRICYYRFQKIAWLEKECVFRVSKKDWLEQRKNML